MAFFFFNITLKFNIDLFQGKNDLAKRSKNDAWWVSLKIVRGILILFAED